MNIGAFLLAMVSPLIGRILVSLGFSVVTMVGLELVFSTIKGSVVSGINSLPADVLSLFLLAGGGEALGIITGAITTRIFIMQLQQGTRILGVNPG